MCKQITTITTLSRKQTLSLEPNKDTDASQGSLQQAQSSRPNLKTDTGTCILRGFWLDTPRLALADVRLGRLGMIPGEALSSFSLVNYPGGLVKGCVGSADGVFEYRKWPL